MAELEGLGEAIGDEGGGDEPQGQLGGADAVAVALALDAARHDPALSRATREYLERQRRLVDLQIGHFDEEHRLAIAAAKRRSVIDRLRIGLQLLVAVIGAAVVFGIAMMLWSAIADRSVVIDAVSVPTDLADQGYTGEAIAQRILDRLTELNRLSTSVRAANSYASSLGANVKLEIPETGVSIGELSRMLHEWLGHPTHVGGEISHTGANVSVRIRVGVQYAAETTGAATDLESLVQDAATRIYAQTQPYRYGYWLYTSGNTAEAATVFRALAVTGPPGERIWALHGLALLSEMNGGSIAFDRQALALDPNFALARLTVSEEHFALGLDEQALKESRAVIGGERGSSDATLSRRGETEVRAFAASEIATALGDYQGALADDEAVGVAADNDERRLSAWRDRINVLIGLHDAAAASNALALLPPESEPWFQARVLYLRASESAERNDWAGAAMEAEQAIALLAKIPQASQWPLRVRISPLLALAYARLGRATEADAVLAAIPSDVYEGWCIRGEVATLRKDYANAEKAFTEAVREAPSIPRAYLDWGQMLAAKGDLVGAMDKYAEANRRGPQWADPLKAWGDALLTQGHGHQALSKYDAALKRAPNWAELQAARGKAARITT